MSADCLPFVVDARPPALVQAHALFPRPVQRQTSHGWEPLDCEPGSAYWGVGAPRPPLRSHPWRV